MTPVPDEGVDAMARVTRSRAVALGTVLVVAAAAVVSGVRDADEQPEPHESREPETVVQPTPGWQLIDPGEAAQFRAAALAGLDDALAALPPADRADDFVLDDHLACIPVDVIYHCPLVGWQEELPDVATPVEPGPATNPDGSVVPDGDLGREERLEQVRALPVAEQVELLRADLDTAVAGAGKALLLATRDPVEGVSDLVLAAFVEARVSYYGR